MKPTSKTIEEYRDALRVSRPLGEADTEILKYRGVARKVAQDYHRRYSFIPFDDFDAECLLGVFEGLKRFREEKGSVMKWVYMYASFYAQMHVTREKNRGGRPMRYRGHRTENLTALGSRRLPGRVDAEGYEEGDWTHLLLPLPPQERDAVTLRYRGGKSMTVIARLLKLKNRKCASAVVSQGVKNLRRENRE